LSGEVPLRPRCEESTRPSEAEEAEAGDSEAVAEAGDSDLVAEAEAVALAA